MTMTSIKIKFRPSTVDGKEGGLYFQIIHNRVVRQLNTDYRKAVDFARNYSICGISYHLE